MSFGLQNWLMLAGLAGVAIPIIIHLLNRRRFDIVDWGAMRFLKVSEITRRKIFIEELLLMLLRMGLIAILVLAMAAPWAAGPVIEWLGLADNRDVVLIFDGGAPMSYTDDSDKSLQQKAVAWSNELLDKLAPGDNIAVLQAREQPVRIVPELISDHRQIRKALEKLPAPAGVCDWSQALEEAQRMLKTSRRPRREIILIGDGRKTGWADESALNGFKRLAPQLKRGDPPPRLWAVTLERPAEPTPNWSLTPLRTGRSRASALLKFTSTVKVTNQEFQPPYTLAYTVDQADQDVAGLFRDEQTMLDLLQKTLKDLPLTEKQKSQTQEIHAECQKKMQQAQEEFRTASKPDHNEVLKGIEKRKLDMDDKLKEALNIEHLFKVEAVLAQARKEARTRRGGELPLPGSPGGRNLNMTVKFYPTFSGPGSHLVSLVVEPDDPLRKKDKSQTGIPIKDRIPGDNRQDFAVMLSLLPVLLVEGQPPKELHGADFLREALARTKDPRSQPRLTRPRIAPLEELNSETGALKQDIGPEPNTPPRVLVLCDVPHLTETQRNVIGKFVEEGGGLLITHGPRTDNPQARQHINRDLYLDGQGWLPVRLEEAAGNEEERLPPAGKPDPAGHPLTERFTHPAVELFRRDKDFSLDNARFPRYWKLAEPKPPGEAKVQGDAGPVVVGNLITVGGTTPFLVEKKYGKGRVIQCCVPLDDSWGTNLHQGKYTEGFPPLTYELISYLAETSGAETSNLDCNLIPGQPLVFPQQDRDSDQATLRTPLGEEIALAGKNGLFVYQDTRLPGVYTLTPRSTNRAVYFVVQPDSGGADDLSLCKKEDREKVTEVLGVTDLSDRARMLAGTERDLWWLLLFGVIALLCSEVWMTRRIARSR